jgi:hypothetical protein
MMQCNQTDKRFIYDNFTDKIVDQIWAEAYYIYKNNPDYNISISDFNDEENEMMYNTQRKFKTFKGDDLSNDLIEILNAEYELNELGAFKSKDDFVNQALGKTNGDTRNLFNRIDAIPLSYINHYLSCTRNNRPNIYIIEMLADEWREVKKHNYNGQRLHCLVRRDKA